MRAVFHLSSDDPDVHGRILSNVTNLLDDESVDLDDVAVVTNGGGLHLVTTASAHRDRVAALRDRGVAFKQCENTMDGTGLGPGDLLEGVEVVPSGVGELVRLQEAGYAYLTP